MEEVDLKPDITDEFIRSECAVPPEYTWDRITRDHIESFNYLLEGGLEEAVADLMPMEFCLPPVQLGANPTAEERNGYARRTRVMLKITSAMITKPSLVQKVEIVSGSEAHPVYPAECRQRSLTYKGNFVATISAYMNNNFVATVEAPMGTVPIMVRSKACHLYGVKEEDLAKHKEEPKEIGGYFIVNGNEKLVRMLSCTRRNYPLAMQRDRWKLRGDFFSEFGINVRSVRRNHSACNMTLHYLYSNCAVLNIFFRKEMFFVPLMVIMKACVDLSDRELMNEIMRDRENDTVLRSCVLNMLTQAHEQGLHSKRRCLRHLGSIFRVSLFCPAYWTDEQVGSYLLAASVCIHLDTNVDKFNFLVHMLQKLLALIQDRIEEDNPDSNQFHEVSLPGHLFLMIIKERLQTFLPILRKSITEEYEKRKPSDAQISSIIAQQLNKLNRSTNRGGWITRHLEYLMATGNLLSDTGLGMQQASGLTVVAEKINYYRFISHFRAIHRGAFFAQMRTTSVRKLLPEAWGFICPVHTPDGTPCGLLNHLAALAQVVCSVHCETRLEAEQMVVKALVRDCGLTAVSSASLFGSTAHVSDDQQDKAAEYFTVIIDGRVVGRLLVAKAKMAELVFRRLKLRAARKVEAADRSSVVERKQTIFDVLMSAEFAVVPITGKRTQYPGVYVFMHAARMIRPVRNLLLGGQREWIGIYEQVYMQICITEKEAAQSEKQGYPATHQELCPDAILSVLASTTPWSDHNQSPRNMYQCQMGKQTMGWPGYCLKYRSDNKMYRIQTPQSPYVSTEAYRNLGFDTFPLGTNAIVCVISYTGMDMEDAMIINKSSYERGFKAAAIYKSYKIDLVKANEKSTVRGGACPEMLCRDPEKADLAEYLDEDGLPYPNTYIEEGKPFYCTYNSDKQQYHIAKYKSSEAGYVDHVKVFSDGLPVDHASGRPSNIFQAVIQMRLPRNPVVGDKFASRAGQKGILSYLWPVADMPFTESGMVPDIIFNPHGFPSRMTIGMMIELMAGKAAFTFGERLDCTPFRFDEAKPAVEYFGELLERCGYNYFGTERMYSGLDGREFEVDIFFGVIYYQRLRHMVSDKFQVRTTGSVEQLTRQPTHGRKRGGGIRLGEMERDALLAHGTSFLLQDRLFNCSDGDVARVCIRCRDFLSVVYNPDGLPGEAAPDQITRRRACYVCKFCGSADDIRTIAIPYVFRYLVNELASVNIRLRFDIKDNAANVYMTR